MESSGIPVRFILLLGAGGHGVRMDCDHVVCLLWDTLDATAPDAFAYCVIGVTVVSVVVLRHMHPDFPVQSVCEGLPRGFEIVPRLEVHPELRLHPKEAAQAQCCIRCDPSLPMDNFINATRRHPDRLGQ